MASNGSPIEGLQPSSFKGEFRGRPVRIESVTFDDKPRRILILLDVSGSISYEKAVWDFAMNATADFIKQAPAKDALALVSFSQGVLTKTEFSATREELFQSLNEIAQNRPTNSTKGRRTSLHDTLIEAIGFFGTPVRGDVIYLIGDGEDNFSKGQEGKVREALVESGLRLFYFSLDKGVRGGSRASYQVQGAPPVEQFTKSTGGLLIRVPDGLQPYRPEWVRGRIGSSIAAFYRQISSHYVLEVVLPSAPEGRREWKLELNEPALFNKKHDMFFYQRGLRTCKVQ